MIYNLGNRVVNNYLIPAEDGYILIDTGYPKGFRRFQKKLQKAGIDPKKLTGELPVASKINTLLLGEPWFKHFDRPIIDRYIEAVHKVAENHMELLAEGNDPVSEGNIALTHRKK